MDSTVTDGRESSSTAKGMVSSAPDVDNSTEHFLRIGGAYLQKDGRQPKRQADALAHTPDTRRLLGVLLAATQSRRPVLIEGRTAAKKTALPTELARLANKRLVHVQMHEDIEARDLVGGWQPSWADGNISATRVDAISIIQSCATCLLIHVLAVVAPGANTSAPAYRDCLQRAQQLMKLVHSGAATSESERHRLLVDGTRLVCAVTREYNVHDAVLAVPSLGDELVAICDKARDLCERLVGWARQGDHSSRFSFEFVDSPLVRAMKNGDWVLIDNLTSAPPEVMERLNSLMEGRMTLNVHEHPTCTLKFCLVVYQLLSGCGTEI